MASREYAAAGMRGNKKTRRDDLRLADLSPDALRKLLRLTQRAAIDAPAKSQLETDLLGVAMSIGREIDHRAVGGRLI